MKSSSRDLDRLNVKVTHEEPQAVDGDGFYTRKKTSKCLFSDAIMCV